MDILEIIVAVVTAVPLSYGSRCSPRHLVLHRHPRGLCLTRRRPQRLSNCTGEERRLRALGGTWRTALILTFNDDPEFIWVRANT